MKQPKLFSLSLFLLSALFACHQTNHEIIIQGNVKGLKAAKVYLFNEFPVGNDVPFDSTKIVNGTFAFHFKPDTPFESRPVYIATDRNGYANLSINDLRDKRSSFRAFMMELGVTELSGNYNNKAVTLSSGLQNEFYFNNRDFLNFSNRDTVKRKVQLAGFIQKIKKQPNAFWAMQLTFDDKLYLSNAELESIYNAFDSSVRDNYTGRKLKEFVATRLTDNDLRPNAMLLDTNGNQQPMIDASKKVNMIVFWASWCHPCRQEIPVIKQLAAKIKDERFRLVSVSVDKKTTEWKNALNKEQMPWQQLNAQNATMDRLKIQYNINFIPQIYLIDGNGKLLRRVSGMDEKSLDQMDQTINGYLN